MHFTVSINHSSRFHLFVQNQGIDKPLEEVQGGDQRQSAVHDRGCGDVQGL